LWDSKILCLFRGVLLNEVREGHYVYFTEKK